jgi:hypothetical protein
VEAEIHNGQRGSTLFTGSRETVLKVLAKQFPGVAIEDEDNVPFQPAITGLPQRCKATV